MEVKENKKFALDFDKTLPFVREQIDCGNALSSAVLDSIDFSGGSFFTILPKDTDEGKLYDFEIGNVVPQTIPGERRYFEGLGPVWYVPLVSMRDYLSQFTFEYLKASQNHCVLFDDFEVEPNSPHTKIENVANFFIGKEVYYLLNNKNEKDEVDNSLFNTFLIWHSLVIFTSCSENFISGNSLDVKKACESPKYIVVGAYDRESYIFWEPNKS